MYSKCYLLVIGDFKLQHMETIGVTSIEPWFVLDDDPMIKDLIYFDKLIYSYIHKETLEKFCNTLPNGKNKFKEKIQEIERLEKAGLISEYKFETFNADKAKFGTEQSTQYAIKVLELASNFSTKDKPFEDIFVDFLKRFREVGQLYTRLYSIVLNQKEQNVYTPIIRSIYYDVGSSEIYTSSTVLSVLFKKFPSINDNIELERLIDFKSDPDTQLKLARLKDWVLEISRKNYSEKEIEQKIDYLLLEYTKQLEFHKLKYKLGSIETVVTISLEVLENLVKLSFSKAAKVFFDLTKKNLNLLEAESKFTGKELALIYKLNEKNRL